MGLKSNDELGLEPKKVTGKVGRMVEGGMLFLGPKKSASKKITKKRKKK